ncbi:ribonuclease III domain-containing protein [Fusobacterium massiliense]|uniref:Mini-ribonuclease 3 n=1 Tax=Fusobacterium massiliense TaxID=1852365 RepID=UPI0028D62E6F|nr:ribonuclease III domain-containing protein [Fusobacterium massiliense]
MVNVEKDIREYSGLELAYIGDAVWEIKMREHYLSFGYSIFKLNKEVKAKVNAKFQSLVYNKIIDSLDAKFQTIGKRAKNSNIKTFPKSCTVMEYKEATALEAIIGAMYLLKKEEDINKIINLVIEGERNGNF